MKSLKNFCIILMVIICAFSFFACGESGVQDNTPKTQEELEFEQFISDYRKLEKLSKAYDSSNYQKRVLVYIRSSRYNSNQWKILGGVNDEDFVAYIHEKAESLEYLRTKEILTYPNSGDEIDFVHMIATINLLNTNSVKMADLGGWGGDICQLVQEIKNTDKTGDELKELVQSKFNNVSAFGKEDVLADLDAVNVYSIYNSQKNKSFADAFATYYKAVSDASRRGDFANYLFNGQNVSTLSQKVDYLFSRLNNNYYLSVLNDNYGISFEGNEAQFRVCIEVFVEYLFE